MLDGLRALAANALRRAADLLDGDNTGVISPPEIPDADEPVPPQDPVTPEALALLRARGPADTIPDAPAADFFERAALDACSPRVRRRFAP